MKKGEISTVFLVSVIITIIIAMFLINGTMQSLKAAMIPSEKKTTERNMVTLANEIGLLLDDYSEFVVGSDTVTIAEDYTIIGFDGDYVVTNTMLNRINKPDVPECKDKVCLCYFEEQVLTQEDADETLGRCEPIDGDFKLVGSLAYIPYDSLVSLRGDRRSDVYVYDVSARPSYGLDSEYLILYGKRFLADTKLHIEKVVLDVQTIVMVTEANQRTIMREKYLKKCSENSDETCKDKYSDDIIRGDEVIVCKKARESDRCYEAEIEECKEGPIDYACACGNKEFRSGYCFQKDGEWFYSPVNCDEITSCEGYCGGRFCNPEEREVCLQDFCKVGNPNSQYPCFCQPD